MAARTASRTLTARKTHAERVADILAAAREAFAASGYDGAAMADIARRAGLTEGAIYKHVASKRELLYRVTGDVFEPLVDRLAREVEPLRGTESRLRYLVWRQLEQLTSHKGLSRVVIRAVRPQDDEYGEVVVAMQRRVSALVLRIIDEGVAAGELRADASRTILRDLLLGTLEHLVWKAVSTDAPFDAASVADQLVDLVLHGCIARRGPAALDRLECVVDRLEALTATPDPETR